MGLLKPEKLACGGGAFPEPGEVAVDRLFAAPEPFRDLARAGTRILYGGPQDLIRLGTKFRLEPGLIPFEVD